MKSSVFSLLMTSDSPRRRHATSGSGTAAPEQNTGVKTAPSARVTSEADTEMSSGASKHSLW